MKKIFTLCLLLVAAVQGWAFEQDKYYTINRNGETGSYIYAADGVMQTGALNADNGVYVWQFIPTGKADCYYIKNVATDTYMQTCNITLSTNVQLGNDPVEYYVSRGAGTYMQTSAPKDFGTKDNAAVFTTTNPTSQGSGSTKFNGDGDSQAYIDGSDDANLVRFVTNGKWINVQNGAGGTPTYNNGEGGWTIHYVYELTQVEGFAANISAAQYSTMYTTYAVDLSQVEGQAVKAYYVKANGFENSGYVTLTEVPNSVIPAYTPVILYAETPGTYTLPCVTAEGTALSDNLLEGSFVDSYVTGDAYVLSNHPTEGLGLYKAQMNQKGDTAFKNNGGKAYLPATNVPVSVSVQGFKFGDFTSTAIEGVAKDNEGAKVIYDLSGRRINNITNAGIYIIGGKKVMVK